MVDFVLDPQLEDDSFFMRQLSLSQLRLHNQKNIPWLILVPRRANVKELCDLSQSDRQQLMEEISSTQNALRELYAPDKINVGAIGNIVSQLHIHVVARYTTDALWPTPVWGRTTPDPYSAPAIALIKEKLVALNF